MCNFTRLLGLICLDRIFEFCVARDTIQWGIDHPPTVSDQTMALRLCGCCCCCCVLLWLIVLFYYHVLKISSSQSVSQWSPSPQQPLHILFSTRKALCIACISYRSLSAAAAAPKRWMMDEQGDEHPNLGIILFGWTVFPSRCCRHVGGRNRSSCDLVYLYSTVSDQLSGLLFVFHVSQLVRRKQRQQCRNSCYICTRGGGGGECVQIIINVPNEGEN